MNNINQFDEKGEKHGYWEYQYNSNSHIYATGNYLNDEPNGLWKFYWNNGNLMAKGNFINDKHDGCWEYYSEDGEFNGKTFYL